MTSTLLHWRHARLHCALAAALAVSFLAGTASAEQVIFVIDPAQSSSSWSGALDSVPYSPQFPGSLSASLSGHFLVEFDPTTPVPSSIQFLPNHGYYEPSESWSAMPGPGGVGGPAPANYAGQVGATSFAVRNFAWDFYTPAPLLGVNGAFAANQTKFNTLGGHNDVSAPYGPGTIEYDGPGSSGLNLTGGEWRLSETSSGNWELVLDNGYFDFGSNTPTSYITHSASLVAKAQFGAGNTDTLDANYSVEVLGGASVPGGVAIEFLGGVDGGEVSVQQVFDTTGLSQSARAALESDSLVQLSTASGSTEPQIWNILFSEDLGGQYARVVLHYDPALLSPGLDELTLGVWHFNGLSNQWEFGGTVNPGANTITYDTTSFSPFMLGVAVPEPSSLVLAGGAGLAFVALACCRRRTIPSG